MAKYLLTRRDGEEITARNEAELRLYVTTRNNPIIGVKKIPDMPVVAKKATYLGHSTASKARRAG